MQLGCEKKHQNSASSAVITKKLGRVTGSAHKGAFPIQKRSSAASSGTPL